MAKPKVALQMYTVRDEAQKDFVGTFKAVARIGYTSIETSGTGGLPSQELKRVLDELGLAVASAHVGLELLEGQLDQQITYFREVGCRDLVVPALPQGHRGSKDGYRRAADSMNRIGARCKEMGARLSYHNHAFEFERFDGRLALELLYEKTDPHRVAAEIDTYWVQYGGGDPVDWIHRVKGRMPAIHCKDYAVTANKPHFAEVGHGNLDWQRILAACRETGVEWYIVEQDDPVPSGRDIFESIRMSYEFLAQNI